MLKYLFMMVLMIPLSFNKYYYWLKCGMYFVMSFLFMLEVSFTYLISNISYYFGVDLLSFSLIILSIWISGLMMMASFKIYSTDKFIEFFMFLILMLLLMLFCSFSSMNLFQFYIFFECSLIPILFLIMGWGLQVERLQAGIYLLFYTLFLSLPMMVGIFYIYFMGFSLSFLLVFNKFISFYLYMSMILCLLVKMPMYLMHLWLPKAHVEAPISGSMILAGILLKLGGYGLIRVIKYFIVINMKYSFIFMSVSLVGGVLVSLLCLSQVDMKVLIAYSSVVHMSMVVCGILSMNYWGLYGALIMMLAHGLCSSGLFCLANFGYERLGSRSMFLNKGLLNYMPSMGIWWFLLCSSNMSAPPSMNLLGEICLINSILSFNFLSMFILIMLMFFSAAYSLYLFTNVQHGKIYGGSFMCSSGTFREYVLVLLHWLPLNVLFLKLGYMFNFI